HLRCGAGKQRRIGYPAARLNELRGADVLVVQKNSGGEIDETRALIGPIVENLRHPKRAGTDAQRISQRHLQLGDDAGVDPYLADLGRTVGGSGNTEGRIRDPHMAAQRIAGGDRIEGGELTGVAIEY